MADFVCRIQDRHGRGPYKPGFSRMWSERDSGPDPIFIAFPKVLKQVHSLVAHRGGQAGCAFRSLDQARNWFSPGEVLKLATLGYSLCWIRPGIVLAENADQCVLWTPRPFNECIAWTGWRNQAA